jgi:adenylate cyclase
MLCAIAGVAPLGMAWLISNMSTPERQLAAIVIADVAGYARLVEVDADGTQGHFGDLAENIIKPLLKQHNGRLIDAKDDTLLSTFTSAVAAVNFAVDVQRTLPIHQGDWPSDQRMRLRLGINLGDVIVKGDSVTGDGVKVAAALLELADPGGIVVAGNVLEQVRRRLDHVAFEDMGPREVENMPDPVPVYRVLLDPSVIEEEADGGKILTGRRIALALMVLVLFAGAALWKLRG